MMAGNTSPSNRRAVALLSVLWIVAIVGTITMIFTRQSNTSLKINRNINDATHAELLAEAGIHRLIAELVQDDLETLSDSNDETWSNNQLAFGDVQLGRGFYRMTAPSMNEEDNTIRYGAVDECSKLNINVATKEMLMLLPNAEPEIVEPVIDWRDGDEDPSEFGAEDEYYQSLEEPYITKNDLFDSLEELLLVKDMTLDILYGEDTNLNGILDANENDGEKNFPLDNGDGELERGWYPYITMYSYEKNVTGEGEERININSAQKQELQENFSGDLTDEEIGNIIAIRDENNFTSVGDLLDTQAGEVRINLSKDKLKQIIDRITVTDDEQLFGRININTAPAMVLNCIIEENEDLVNAIVEYRESSDGPFENIGGLLDLDGVTNDIFKTLSGLVCTKSSVFSAKCAGYIEISRAYKEVFAILDWGIQPPEIRYWKVIR